MSMNTCFSCGDVYDTDFQMKIDENGEMICDKCWEETRKAWIEKTIVKGGFTGKISVAQWENISPYYGLERHYTRKLNKEEEAKATEELTQTCHEAFKKIAELAYQDRIAKTYKDIRWYTHPNGKKVPSVTSVINLDKDFNIPQDELNQYASRGTLIHKQVEIFLNTGEWKEPKDIQECSSDYLTVVKGCLGLEFDNVNFRAFYESYPFTVIELEKVVYGADYAGRMDILCTIDSKNKKKWEKIEGVVYDEPVILDLKSGTELDQISGLTQQSAYAIADGVKHIGLIHLTKKNQQGFSKPVVSSNIERYWNLFSKKRETFRKRYGI